MTLDVQITQGLLSVDLIAKLVERLIFKDIKITQGLLLRLKASLPLTQ